MSTKAFTIGDFVHFKNDVTQIYEIVKTYPYWYKGKEHVEIKPVIPHIRAGIHRHTSAWKLVHAGPELLL